MTFETNKDVLDWYEKQQPHADAGVYRCRCLGTRFRTHPLDKRLVPVLLYMRDVETLTDMYHRELRRTPTGRDPVISKFMERWGIEEDNARRGAQPLSERSRLRNDDRMADQRPGERSNDLSCIRLSRHVAHKPGRQQIYRDAHDVRRDPRNVDGPGLPPAESSADHPVLTQILERHHARRSAAHAFLLERRKARAAKKRDSAQKIAR